MPVSKKLSLTKLETNHEHKVKLFRRKFSPRESPTQIRRNLRTVQSDQQKQKQEAAAMAGTDDLARLSLVDLIHAYFENARSYESTNHVGLQNDCTTAV